MNVFFRLKKQLVSRLTPNLPSYLKTPFLISFLLSSVLSLSFLVLYFTIQPIVPLFYSLAEPQDFLAPKEFLVLFPLMSFTITFLHLYLIRFLKTYEKIIQQLFSWITVLIQILFALAFFRIITIIS
jgi:hypothetical protein